MSADVEQLIGMVAEALGRVAQLEGRVESVFDDLPEQEDSSPPSGGGGGVWSGRIWVAGTLYDFSKDSQFAIAKWVKVKIGPMGYTVTLQTSDFPHKPGDETAYNFPGDEEHYDLAYTTGDIHCDRF